MAKKLIARISSVSAGAKSSFALFFANVVTTGIAYITTPIFTRLLSVAEYGQVSLFLTWQQLIGIVAMFSLSAGVFNNGMVDYPEDRSKFSFSLLILSNVITFIVSILLFIFYPLIDQYLGFDIPLLILMMVMFLVQPAYNFWTSRQKYELKYKKTVLWSIICAVISPIVAIVCLVLPNNNHLYSRLFGSLLPLIIIYAGFYLYLARQSNFKIDFSYWKFAFLFNLPLIPHYLSVYILSSSDRLMIAHYVGEEATAFYSVAHSVGVVAMILWSAVNASLIPYTYENCKRGNYSAISKVTIPILFVISLVCLLVILLAPECVSIMATKEYMEAIYVIPPIVGSVFFQCLYFVFANILYYYKKPAYVMLASLSATGINIVLNMIFIPKYGYLAAGYTTLVSYAIQAIIDFILLKRVITRRIYDMRLICAMACVVVVIAVTSNMLYGYDGIRYTILAIVSLFLCIHRIRILSLLTIKK